MNKYGELLVASAMPLYNSDVFRSIKAIKLKNNVSIPLINQPSEQSLKLPLQYSFHLSKRLKKIEQMAGYSFQSNKTNYEHLWDCCCDHGLLGFSLLSRLQHVRNVNIVNTDDTNITEKSPCIHFADIVPDLMSKVEAKLKRFYSDAFKVNDKTADDRDLIWQTHCVDVATLPLTEYKGRHLIIIAGVGGDLMIEFVEAIYQQHKSLPIDFLLCPVHHQYALREKLIELKFTLIDEALVEDNQRFYEIIHVSSSPNMADNVLNNALNTPSNKEHSTDISPVGEKIWQTQSNSETDIANRYLAKTLNHYLRIKQGIKKQEQGSDQQNTASKVQHIINAYRAIY